MSELRILSIGFVGVAAPSLQPPSFDPYDVISVFVLVTGLSVAGQPRLRFNLDVATTAYAFSVSDNFAAPTSQASGTASGILLSQTSSTGPVGSEMTIGNGPGQGHSVMYGGFSGILDASVAPHTISGAGVWSTTSQINTVTLDSGPNGGNLNVGTGILVMGLNP